MAGRISYYGGIVTNGLVLDLDAAKRDSYAGVGTAWNDISGNRNNGVLTNGPTFNSSNGGSIVFDGTNDYFLINNTPTLNPPSAISCCSFFNIASVTNYAPICFKQNNYSGFFEQYVLYLTNTELGIAVTGVDRSQKIAKSSIDYRNQNIYAVGTCDTITDELKLYINGNLIQTVSFTSTFDIADTPLQIGGTGVLKFGAIYSGQANGRIYQTLIYNRALTATEVLQNYNATRGRFGL